MSEGARCDLLYLLLEGTAIAASGHHGRATTLFLLKPGAAFPLSSIVRNEGIVGEGVTLTIEHLKEMRDATILFHVTRRLLFRHFRDPGVGMGNRTSVSHSH